MIHLPDSLNAWGSTRFEAVLKRELASHAADPTPVEPQHEYCELLLIVDRATAAAVVLVQ